MASNVDLTAADASSQCEVAVEGAALYSALSGLCENNVGFFENDQSECGQKLKQSLTQMQECLQCLSPKVEELRKVAPKFDFDEDTPYNGFRSFVTTVDMCITYCIKLSRQILTNRSSYFFRKAHYVKELETCAQMMDSLKSLADLNLKLLTWTHSGNLFAMDKSQSFEEIYIKISEINLYCFYGRCIGFQFKESLQQVMKTLGIMLASFSEVYFCDGGNMLTRATNSVWHSSKYLLDPELRAKRIFKCTIWASVEFCKAFWFLGEIELLNKVPNLVYSSVAVNRLIKLEPEPLKIISMDGCTIDVPIPSSSLGVKPLNIRLIAKLVYEGMEEDICGNTTKTAPAPKCSELIFHCHGGGFVAQSSRSHEMYLREWAITLNCPLVSVDYSLAPEAPFPRAVEDALYAYCWMLNNASQLGSTAEKIIFAGDSAGANLVLSLAYKCIELRVRPPDGIFLAYAPVLISFLPSPARLLSLLDPILPIGFLSACLRAYADPQSANHTSKYEHKLKRTSSMKIIDPNVPVVSSPIEKPETVIMDVNPKEKKYPPNIKTDPLLYESNCDKKSPTATLTGTDTGYDADQSMEETVISMVGLEFPVSKKPSPPVETLVAPRSRASLTSSSSVLINTIQQVTTGQDGKSRRSQPSSLCPTNDIPIESKSSIEDFTGKAGVCEKESRENEKCVRKQTRRDDTESSKNHQEEQPSVVKKSLCSTFETQRPDEDDTLHTVNKYDINKKNCQEQPDVNERGVGTLKAIKTKKESKCVLEDENLKSASMKDTESTRNDQNKELDVRQDTYSADDEKSSEEERNLQSKSIHDSPHAEENQTRTDGPTSPKKDYDQQLSSTYNTPSPEEDQNMHSPSSGNTQCSKNQNVLPPSSDKTLIQYPKDDQNLQSSSGQDCRNTKKNLTEQADDHNDESLSNDDAEVATKDCLEEPQAMNNTQTPQKVLSEKEESKSETDDETNSKLRPEFSRAVDSVTTAITNVFINFTKSNNQAAKVDQGVEALDEEEITVPLEYFTVKTPADYYLSPILAPDSLLKSLPPVKLLTAEMDPFLDDCVSFARKLKALDHNVSLDVLPGLPHGFLTFALINKEAHEGSELCCTRIRELLDMPAEEGTEAASVKPEPCPTIAAENEKVCDPTIKSFRESPPLPKPSDLISDSHDLSLSKSSVPVCKSSNLLRTKSKSIRKSAGECGPPEDFNPPSKPVSCQCNLSIPNKSISSTADEVCSANFSAESVMTDSTCLTIYQIPKEKKESPWYVQDDLKKKRMVQDESKKKRIAQVELKEKRTKLCIYRSSNSLSDKSKVLINPNADECSLYAIKTLTGKCLKLDIGSSKSCSSSSSRVSGVSGVEIVDINQVKMARKSNRRDDTESFLPYKCDDKTKMHLSKRKQ